MPATSPKGATSSLDAPWLSVSEQCLLLVLLGSSPLIKKTTFPNSNSIRNQADEETICACATYKSLLNYLS